MEFIDVVREREATRKFSNKLVSDEIIKNILEVGRLAPTAKNLQPQKIYVIKSEEGINRIDKCTPCRYNAPCVLLVCSDKNIAWSNGTYSTYEMDASIVATHLMLGSKNYGVDSIWVEMFDKDLTKKEFNLDNNIEPICLIPIGYRSDDYSGSINHNNRKDLSETTIII